MASAVPATAKFFRGGQAHGPLSHKGAPSGVSKFVRQHAGVLAGHVRTIMTSTGCAKVAAMHKLGQDMVAAGRALGGGDYWRKRFLELIVLAASRSWSPGIQAYGFTADDIDTIFAKWPIGNGTLAGIQEIFPNATKKEAHEAIRTLQKALGSGRCRIPLMTISAMLCNWHRVDAGLMAGTYHKRRPR